MKRPAGRFYFLVLVAALQAGCGPVSSGYEDRGDRYYRNGQYDDSLAEYLMAQRTRGLSSGLLRKIGKVYVMKGDFVQAKSYYDRYFKSTAEKSDPGVLLDYFQIAVERGKIGDQVTMVRALEEILLLDPSYSLGKYFFELGEYYFQQSNYRRAIPYYLRGMPLRLEVENRQIYLYHLAQSYENLEDYFNAYLYFDQFLALYPEHPLREQALWHRCNCCFPLARQLQENGEFEEALFYLEVIIGQGQPQHYLDDAWFLRGEILSSLGRTDEARKSFQQVLKLNRYYWKEKIAGQARQRILELDLQSKSPL